MERAKIILHRVYLYRPEHKKYLGFRRKVSFRRVTDDFQRGKPFGKYAPTLYLFIFFYDDLAIIAQAT